MSRASLVNRVDRVFQPAIWELKPRVFETRTATGSELFSLLTCHHTTTFTLLSIFPPLEMISIANSGGVGAVVRSLPSNPKVPGSAETGIFGDLLSR